MDRIKVKVFRDSHGVWWMEDEDIQKLTPKQEEDSIKEIVLFVPENRCPYYKFSFVSGACAKCFECKDIFECNSPPFISKIVEWDSKTDKCVVL